MTRSIFARDLNRGFVPGELVRELPEIAAEIGAAADADLPDVIPVVAGGSWRCELIGGRLVYRLWIREASS